MKSKLLFDVPHYKKLRVIIDTDAACEADNPFAIAPALMSPKLMVKGILAEHFVAEGSVQKSYDEVCTILDAGRPDAALCFVSGSDNQCRSRNQKVSGDFRQDDNCLDWNSWAC